jgi:hypothetical protein
MNRLCCRLAFLGSLVLPAFLSAQAVPPAQTHVAAIGAAPLRAPATADFAPGAFFTMEGWFYRTDVAPFAWLMGKGLATAGADPFLAFGLLLDETGTRVRFSASTGAAGSGRDVTAPAALPLRTWTHVAAVMDGTSMRLVINGTVVASGTASGTPPAAPNIALGVGVAYQANGSTNFPAFPGYARQVRVWDVARTAAQLAAGASVALPADRSGLVAAWPLDESSGATARDLSGANRALTVPSGQLSATRADLLENPFYAVTATTPAGNALADVDDGILFDFDGDGDLDLVTTHLRSPPTLPETRVRLRAFRNNAGTFADATDAVLGNVTMVHPRHHAIADFNGDGRPDLLIIGHGTDRPPYPGEQAKLLIRTADSRLADETASRLPIRNDFTHNVAVGDIDGDGDIDIYMANINGDLATTGGPCFYLNNGSGVFTAVLDRLPADIANRTRGVVYTASALADVNLDGHLDLLLGAENTAPANLLLLNDGAGRFTAQATFALPPKILSPGVTTAITVADLNGDAAPDLVLSTSGGQITMPTGEIVIGYSIAGLQLLLNRGDGTFYDASSRLNVTFNSVTDTWIEWIRVADLNRDGRPDLVLQGAPNSRGLAFSRTILLNRGAAVFTDASDAYAGGMATFLHPADVDRDGLVDLVGVNPNAITVSRALRPLDRALFENAPDQPGRLANLSVRTQAGTGDQTLIVGFAVGGGTGTKPLLIRAIGPTLAAFGVEGALADPAIDITTPSGARLAGNDNWGGSAALKNAFAAVGAFGLAADASADAALLYNAAPNSYTATVSSGSPGPSAAAAGIALVELYDSGTTNVPRLTNVSARTQVGVGADALIAGFVVSGNVPKKLLIRATGPTLNAFGVGGALADPVLQVRALGNENILAFNDDWRGTVALKEQFQSVGAFRFFSDASRDAAVAVELPPGAYTATVSGKNNTTGVALVEVYELP